MKKYLILFFISLSFLVGCHRKAVPKTDIVTSIFPIYDICQQICGDKLKVDYLIPTNANPHTYELVPLDLQKIENASYFIGVDTNFDAAILKYFKKEQKTYFIHQGEGNPHVWLSLKNAKQITKDLTAYIISIDPANKDFYQKNCRSYLKQIEMVDEDLAPLFIRSRGKSFVQWHEAWNYLAADYQLNVFATISRGDADIPSIKMFNEIITKSKRARVKVIVCGVNTNNSTLNTLAKETNSKIVRLDSLGGIGLKGRETYLELMQYNLQKLAKAYLNE